MDPIGVGGLLLSAVGVGISVYALFKADSAERAVEKTVKKSDDQTTRDDARHMLIVLAQARDAAMANRQGTSAVASKGRSMQEDVKSLERAQDLLATTTLSDGQLGTSVLRQAAREIDRALKSIAMQVSRDGWGEALATLQGVTPKIDALQRRLGSQSLR